MGENVKLKRKGEKKELNRFCLKRFQFDTLCDWNFFVSPDHSLAIIQLHQNSHSEAKPCGLASLL